eukprot:TRINITY_DN91684_c0_g1_i1.p1 TRINITY_DN91684_c0_g1~~TRINITY_DN91684_c0_g1_i1.p1  ORF type:complete len:494 (+),score=114.45 TRINITY_DN91684_c0_g1_i1:115-1596(+)
MGCGAGKRPEQTYTAVLRPGVTVSAKKRFDELYTLGKPIACGAGGMTYRAKQRGSGTQVVVKKPTRNTDVEDFHLVADKTHPNIVRVFALFTSEVETFIVMEWCRGGDLFRSIVHCQKTFGTVTYNFVAGSTSQFLKGLSYLHGEFRLCHNDVKPENIFLERKPKDVADVPRCMLGDFGCVAKAGGGRDGDPRYNGPELYRSPAKTFLTSDVWAAGVTLYEMLSGGILLYTDHANISGWGSFKEFDDGRLFKKQLEALRSKTPVEPDWTFIQSAGEAALSLCKAMLQWEPSSRITVSAAIDHAWFDLLEANEEPQRLPAELLDALHKRALYNDLKMALLNFVASKLQGKNLQRYQAIFQQFDEDNDGKLNRSEFLAVLKSSEVPEATAASEAEGEQLFLKADVSKEGAVDFNEFVAVMFQPDSLGPEGLEKHCKDIFARLLASGTKTLSSEQLTAMFPEAADEKRVNQLFTEMDTNADGGIDAKEFCNFISKM